MAFSSVAATNTSAATANQTSHTVDLPAGIVSGNLLIVCFSVDGAPSITWPGGWTEFFTVAKNSTNKLALAYRQADGGEASTITVTTGASQRSAHTSYRITGHEDPATQAPEGSGGGLGLDANPDPDNNTPTGGAKDYLWLAVEGHDVNRTTNAFPTDYSNGISAVSSTGAGCGVGSAERQLNAVNEDPGTFTISASDNWVAVTVAVHPAPPVLQTITPTAIASAESFGTTLLKLFLLPTAIASAEAIGSAQVNLTIAPTAIVSAEAFGTAVLRLFPTVLATNTSGEFAANVTSHTVSLPSGIVSGNLLIVCFAVDAGPTITWPGGWTEFFIGDASAAVTLALAYRQADGGEGASITVTTDVSERSAHTSYRIVGHEDPATQSPEASVAATGSNTFPNPGSLTPTGGAKDYLWLAIHGHDDDSSTTVFPTNYTDGLSIEGGGTTDGCGIASAERQLAVASEDPDPFTISAVDRWVAATVAVHPPAPAAPQTLDPSAIASAEAFGTAQVNQTLSPTAIPSSEAFGTAQLNLQIAPTAIASAEAFGTAVLELFLLPTAIASAETFGTPQLNFALAPTAISSAEVFGAATVVPGPITTSPTAIGSAEAFGTAQVNLTIAPPAIPTDEAFGSATVVPGGITTSPTAIASAEAFGTAQINLAIAPTAIASAEAFGTAQLNLAITPTAIASAEVIGAAQVNLTIILTAIASAEAFGTPTVTLAAGPQTISDVGAIASAEAFGTAVLELFLQPTAVGSDEAFGTAQVNLTITPTAIASAEVHGATTVLPGPITTVPTAIASAEAFGTATLELFLQSTAIVSSEAFGTAQLVFVLAPTAISSDEAFGTLSVLPGVATIIPNGIISGEAFGVTVFVGGIPIPIERLDLVLTIAKVVDPRLARLTLFSADLGLLRRVDRDARIRRTVELEAES